MSHQSGIVVSEELRSTFASASQGNSVRFIIAVIENEEVVTKSTSNGSGSDWKQDLDQVAAAMNDTDARYVLFNKGDDGWILMSYVPDKAKVKAKMLYASTRATVKRMLGANFFTEEMFGSVTNDLSQDGYAAHVAHEAAAAPLTAAEFNQKEEQEAGEIYAGGAGAYVHGVSFPAEAGVADALKTLVSSGSKNYVQLGVDTSKETITLNKNASVTIEALSDEVSLTTPQFHFFRYVHESYDEVIFVFTCPDGSGSTTACPIKERMLYSSTKQSVVQMLEAQGGTLAKSFEFNEPKDVVKEDIDHALHPPKAAPKAKFSKPARPGRGARKLIRTKK